MNRNNTEQKSDVESLRKAISALPQSERSFELFSFSNEYDFAETLQELENISPVKTEENKIKVVLLVGESNILSGKGSSASTEQLALNRTSCSVLALDPFRR